MIMRNPLNYILRTLYLPIIAILFSLTASVSILIIGPEKAEAGYLHPPPDTCAGNHSHWHIASENHHGPNHPSSGGHNTSHGHNTGFPCPPHVRTTDCSVVVLNRCRNAGYYTNELRVPPPGPVHGVVEPIYEGLAGRTEVFTYCVSNENSNGGWDPDGGGPKPNCGAPAAEHFISHMWIYINSADLRHRMGGAYIVNSMMGRWGTDFGCDNSTHGGTNVGRGGTAVACINNGIAFARNVIFNDWANRVRNYSAAGFVNWNYWHGAGCFDNTSAVGHTGGPSDRGFPHDITHTYQCPAENPVLNGFWAVGFFLDGKSYTIDRGCLNSKGHFPLQPEVDYSNKALISTPISQVERGKDYTIPARLFNDGRRFSPAVRLEVQNQTAAYAVAPHVANNTSSPPADSAGYSTSSAVCAAAPCYYWRYPTLGVGQVRDNSFQFRVHTDAPANSNICFQAFAFPHSSTVSGYAGNQVCFRVIAPREPFVSTSGGSVHGGAGFNEQPCLLTSSSRGFVRGQVRAIGSKADYAVSAGGNINRFGSAGNEFGAGLTFGNTPPFGSYGEVCRPDLAKLYLIDQPAADAGIGGGTLSDVNTLPNGIRSHTGNLTINGGTIAVGKRITLVVNGDVYITGNIGFDATNYTLTTIPSIGIIASGNIHINPAVTNLYGIYYAGSAISAPESGIINTCRTGFGNDPNPPNITDARDAVTCGQQLTVQGALVANRLYLRRTFGDANVAGSSPAELINFIPQLFLRPPEGLSSVSGTIRSQIERPPVF